LHKVEERFVTVLWMYYLTYGHPVDQICTEREGWLPSYLLFQLGGRDHSNELAILNFIFRSKLIFHFIGLLLEIPRNSDL